MDLRYTVICKNLRFEFTTLQEALGCYSKTHLENPDDVCRLLINGNNFLSTSYKDDSRDASEED